MNRVSLYPRYNTSKLVPIIRYRCYSQRIRKDKEFYESEGKLHRRYFYSLDHRGLLFLEEAKFRNYATCLKDKTFLNFFFKQLRPNTTEYYPEIPYVSLCGKELNFLTIDDPIAALVYGDLKISPHSNAFGGLFDLTIGASELVRQFNPALLLSDHEAGRLYHPIQTHKYLEGKLGLLNAATTDMVSASITTSSDSSVLTWHGKDYPIANISSYIEKKTV